MIDFYCCYWSYITVINIVLLSRSFLLFSNSFAHLHLQTYTLSLSAYFMSPFPLTSLFPYLSILSFLMHTLLPIPSYCNPPPHMPDPQPLIFILPPSYTSPSNSHLHSLQEIRRAYYKKSLLWHPDRWTSLPTLYHTAVLGAFELISEAFEGLQGQG